MLQHHATQLMGKPNTLSRWPDHPDGAADNHGLTLLLKQLLEVCSTKAILLDADDSVAKALKALSDKVLVSDEWSQQDGITLHRGHVVRECPSSNFIPTNPNNAWHILPQSRHETLGGTPKTVGTAVPKHRGKLYQLWETVTVLMFLFRLHHLSFTI